MKTRTKIDEAPGLSIPQDQEIRLLSVFPFIKGNLPFLPEILINRIFEARVNDHYRFTFEYGEKNEILLRVVGPHNSALKKP